MLANQSQGKNFSRQFCQHHFDTDFFKKNVSKIVHAIGAPYSKILSHVFALEGVS